MPRWFRHVRRIVILLAVAAAASATAPAASPPDVRVAPGVTVAGVEIGGMMSEPARRLLREHFARPLELSFGKERWQLAPEELSSPAVDDALSEALRSGARAEVDLRVQVRPKRVQRYVRSLAEKYHREPQSAQFVGLGGDLRPAFSPAKPGRRIVQKPVVEAIWHELKTGRRNPIELPSKPIPPKLQAADYGPIIVVQRASKRLTLYSGPRLVRAFGVATGTATYPTPLGRYEIVDMQRDPWWLPPPSDWAKDAKPVPPGPGNPLGTRWMGISSPAVGIHGTPDAASIGYSASHGCIRMRIPEAEWLFTQVRMGTPVVIVDA